MKKMKAGIIGCGNISGVYFIAGQTFEAFDIVACADIVHERAVEKAQEFNIPRACSVEELLGDPDIDIVINLTIPKFHAEIALAVLASGKHVYGEKPLAVAREDAWKVLETANAKGLRVGCAPDTFLGAGLQTCRKIIDDGIIGEPVAATAFLMHHGHERRHPDPEFYYKEGGGPMFDMGPYYLTALISLLGPVKRVTGSARISFPERTITSKPKAGTKISVEVPTHVAGVLDFENGAIGTMITSFDVWGSRTPFIEIYGSEGSLSVPDPNSFGGPVFYQKGRSKEWTEVELTHGYAEKNRGIGVADMAAAIVSGRPHRANGEMAYHVLDIMHGFHDASWSGRHYELKSTCTSPAPFPMGLEGGKLDP